MSRMQDRNFMVLSCNLLRALCTYIMYFLRVSNIEMRHISNAIGDFHCSAARAFPFLVLLRGIIIHISLIRKRICENRHVLCNFMFFYFYFLLKTQIEKIVEGNNII